MYEGEPSIQHINPVESSNTSHRWELEESGADRGYAHVEYISTPFPFYYVASIDVWKSNRGEGHGSRMLNEISKRIQSENAVGILNDRTAYFNNDPHVVGMYERHGWRSIPASVVNETGWMAYNVPETVTEEMLKKAIDKIHTEFFV